MIEEREGSLILEYDRVVRIDHVRVVGGPSTILLEFHDECVTRADDIADQLVAWVDDASL